MIPRTTQPMADSVIERPLTLIEKLNDHKETITVLRGTEKQGSHEFTFLGHHLLGFQTAINIVKQHSEWVPCSERMPNDGENVLFHSIHSRTVSLGCRNKYGREYLWDITDSCGYELDRNISHWQPLPQPPSEVQK